MVFATPSPSPTVIPVIPPPSLVLPARQQRTRPPSPSPAACRADIAGQTGFDVVVYVATAETEPAEAGRVAVGATSTFVVSDVGLATRTEPDHGPHRELDSPERFVARHHLRARHDEAEDHDHQAEEQLVGERWRRLDLRQDRSRGDRGRSPTRPTARPPRTRPTTAATSPSRSPCRPAPTGSR